MAKSRPLPPEGLDKAYRDEAGRLRSLAARAGRDEADDIVHDAVVKTLEAGRRTEILEPVRFLFRVTRNTVVDRLRSRVRRGRVLEYGLEDDAAVADPSAGGERALIASQRLARALAIVGRMAPRRREAFILCRIDELTYAEAARRMGVSVHAVEKHISAAMTQLLNEMDSDPNNRGGGGASGVY